MRRIAATTIAALAAACGLAGAQQPATPPVVTIAMAPGSAEVTGFDGKSGPITFRVTTSSGQRAFMLMELRDGVTAPEAQDIARDAKSARQLERAGRFVASGIATANVPYVTTVALTTGEYAVFDFTRTASVRAVLNVGSQANATVVPQPQATIGLADYRFEGNKTLPAIGTIRVESRGARIHHALLYRLKKGASQAKALKAVRQGKETVPGSSGGGTLVELVSAATVNDVQARYLPGRYILACFVTDGTGRKKHSQRGMARAVRLR
jgi:hypothetical protein